MGKVSFFIIGAPKSGTTSLKLYLANHSKIFTHLQTECTFFYDKNEFDRGGKFLIKNYFFDKRNIEGKMGLIKHAASYFYLDEIRNALAYNPQMHFILLLRNPVERFISSYLMETEVSNYSKSIEESIELAFNDKNSWEYKGFNLYGKYDLIVSELKKVISKDKLHIVLLENLKENPENTIIELLNDLTLQVEKTVIEAAKNTISNNYLRIKNRHLNLIYNYLRGSEVLRRVTAKVPSKYKFKLNSFYSFLNKKEVANKPQFDSIIYDILYEKYKDSITLFELQNNIKTNWLNRK